MNLRKVNSRKSKQLQLRISNPESTAVVGRIADLYNGFAVFYGRISFVLMPVVFRVFRSDLFHIIIPVSFGQYGGSSDAEIFGIPFNDAMIGRFFVFIKPVGVDDQELRFEG